MGEGRCRCCCITYQTRVTLFAVTNVFLSAVQLLLPLISTSFILYFQATKQHFEANYVLHEETLSLFQRIPQIVLRPKDSRKITIAEIGMPPSPLQSDLHVWSSFIFLKLVMLIYSVLLYNGARKKNYALIISWFALNLPMALHALVQLCLDFAFGLLKKKPLNFQIYQVSLSIYQVLGLIFVFFFLRRGRFQRGGGRGARYHREPEPTNVKFRQDPASLHL